MTIRAPSGRGNLWRSHEPALHGVPIRHSGDQSPLSTHVVPKVGAAYAGYQRHAPRLRPVPVQLALRVAASLLLRPRHLHRAHLQDRLDGRTAHDVDHLVDGPLALLEQLDHREQQLSVLRQPAGQLPLPGERWDAPDTILYGFFFIGGLSLLCFSTRLIPQSAGRESPPTFNYAWDSLGQPHDDDGEEQVYEGLYGLVQPPDRDR